MEVHHSRADDYRSSHRCPRESSAPQQHPSPAAIWGLSTQVRGILVCFHGNITFQQHGSTKSAGINEPCYFHTDRRRERPDYACPRRVVPGIGARPSTVPAPPRSSSCTHRTAALGVSRMRPLPQIPRLPFITSGAPKSSFGCPKSISHHSLSSDPPKTSRA